MESRHAWPPGSHYSGCCSVGRAYTRGPESLTTSKKAIAPRIGFRTHAETRGRPSLGFFNWTNQGDRPVTRHAPPIPPPGVPRQPVTGARLILDVLRSEGVDLIFGYPGGFVLPLFDELFGQSDIRLVLPRHEQAAAHAADGYARATGRVGVCLSTSGPGATNLVTGIANAHMDSIPLVVLTGQVRGDLIGNDAFQEVDVLGITRSISKHNYLVKNPEDLPRLLKNAFHIARTGRPGPVVVDVTVDVQNALIRVPVPGKVHMPTYQPEKIATCNPRQIRAAARLINESPKPLFYVGGGLVGSRLEGGGPTAPELLLRAAEKAGIPVTTTLMGLGCFPSRHPLSLRMLGMHGAYCANMAVQECDCLIALGARFADRITGKIAAFAPRARIVQIDLDPASVSKNIRLSPLNGEDDGSPRPPNARPGLPIIGDAARGLAELLPLLENPDRAAWRRDVEQWKTCSPPAIPPEDPAGPIRPQRAVRAVQANARGRDLVVCTEVGQHQMWAALHIDFDRPRQWISSGGLGAMGFGLPAAMGAQLARPEALVVDIAGDGSLQMNIQEFATLASHNLPVKIVVVNNGCLGMVRQWQQLFHGGRYSHTDLSDNPDFVRVAEAYGIRAWRAERPADLDAALSAAYDHPGPALVDVRVAREENVYPMVRAGDALDRMILQ